MPVRPPLAVEVVTKIPVKTGLGIADSGISSAISKVIGSARAAEAKAIATQVVTDIPGVLRNVTPLTFGEKLAGASKVGIGIGSKVLGLGLGVGADLAWDLIFPDPVGLGSDMVGGKKITKSAAPIAAPVTAPRVATKPLSLPAPTAEPFTFPQKTTSTETKPFAPINAIPVPTPAPTPRSDPRQTQTIPKPAAIAIPSPRSALGEPYTPQRSKPVITKSPYPLKTVELDGYGGVNLTYPIAQALNDLPNLIDFSITPLMDKLDIIDLEIQDLPLKVDTAVKELLSKTKIETVVNIPAAVDMTSKIPVAVDLSKQVPIAVDLTSKIPVAVDLSKQIPVAVDLVSKIPVVTDISSVIPVAINLTKQIPVAVDLTSKIPVAVDLSKKIPITVDLSKKIPVAVDLTAKLNPKPNPDVEKLKKCCEDIQKKFGKQFEDSGELICKNGTSPGVSPYAYKGEGLEGIHQLMKIMFDVSKSVLGKVCELEYPVLKGSGTYLCGSSPAINYNYSGVGFIGIQNQIEQLFKLEKVTLGEVCASGTLPAAANSLPNIAGQIEYSGCDNSTQTILFSGNGIQGLSSQVAALTILTKEVLKSSCESSCIPLMPDARFEEFKVTRQLVITWGTKYPTQNTPLWQTSIPNPKDGLEWGKDFENLYIKKGETCGRLYWNDSNIYTGSYFESKEEAQRALVALANLSSASPHRSKDGNIQPRITEGGAVKRKPAQRTLRAVRAAIAEIGSDGEPSQVTCFVPPVLI